MLHPFESGNFWLETHYPQVRILRAAREIQIALYVKPEFQLLFEQSITEGWTYRHHSSQDWIVYQFCLRRDTNEQNETEIKALNTLLNFCLSVGISKEHTAVTKEPKLAQLSFVSAENPAEFKMGAYGLWGDFAAPVTQVLQKLQGRAVASLEEYVGSRMRGAYKVLFPASGLLTQDNLMRLSGGNTLPLFQTFGNCACLSATSNQLEREGGFLLSPHNIDSHIQQFLILVGTLVFWQRMRRIIQKQ